MPIWSVECWDIEMTSSANWTNGKSSSTTDFSKNEAIQLQSWINWIISLYLCMDTQRIKRDWKIWRRMWLIRQLSWKWRGSKQSVHTRSEQTLTITHNSKAHSHCIIQFFFRKKWAILWVSKSFRKPEPMCLKPSAPTFDRHFLLTTWLKEYSHWF